MRPIKFYETDFILELDFGLASSFSQKHLGIETPYFRSFFRETKKGTMRSNFDTR